MRIQIDRAKCMASGNCVLAAPTVFTQDEDGVVTLLLETAQGDVVSQAEAAVRGCPAAAIVIVEHDIK